MFKSFALAIQMLRRMASRQRRPEVLLNLIDLIVDMFRPEPLVVILAVHVHAVQTVVSCFLIAIL